MCVNMWLRLLVAVLLCGCITNSECSAPKRKRKKNLPKNRVFSLNLQKNYVLAECKNHYFTVIYYKNNSSDFLSISIITVEKKNVHCFVS